MKIIMITDIEGCAGVVSFTADSYADAPYYERSKKLATAEVNAACEGLFEGGASEILVIDGHGPGGLNFEEIHPGVRLLHGRPLPPRHYLDTLYRQYDLLVVVGQHAMAGERSANLNHTFSSRSVHHYRLNGQRIGETGIHAYRFGSWGIPLVYLTGDDAACREVEALIPGVTTTAVKESLGANSAISLPASVAREKIRTGAVLALQRQRERPIAPLVHDGPFVLEREFYTTTHADEAERVPGAERIDGYTLRNRGEQFADLGI